MQVKSNHYAQYKQLKLNLMVDNNLTEEVLEIEGEIL